MQLNILITFNNKFELLQRLLLSINSQENFNFSNLKIFILNTVKELDVDTSIFNSYKFKINYFCYDNSDIISAKNKLLNLADGDYIMFCKSEDYFSNKLALVDIYSAINLHKPDILVTTNSYSYLDPVTNNSKNILLSDAKTNLDTISIYGKIFKLSYVKANKLSFISSTNPVEDYYFVNLALNLATSIRFINKTYYITTIIEPDFIKLTTANYIKLIHSNFLIIKRLLTAKVYTQAYIAIEQFLLENYLIFALKELPIYPEVDSITLADVSRYLADYYIEFSSYINKLDTAYMAKLYESTQITSDSIYSWYSDLYTEVSQVDNSIQNTFSIIIPTHNRKKLVCEAINSVLNQKYTAYELIVVDDASTDGTKELLLDTYSSEILSGKLKYIYNDTEFHGPSAARNIGLTLATNSWVAYLDDDNIQLTNFLATFNRAINRNNADCFYARFYNLYNQTKLFYFNADKFNFEKLNIQNFIDIGVFIHKKTLFEKLGGFNTELTSLEDWDLILRYTNTSIPIAIDEFVLAYSDRPDSTRITFRTNDLLNLAKIKSYIPVTAPIVTTLILSYNHENFIEDAIKSAICQRGNFKYSILISDDCSTDNTPNIIKKYIEQFPDLITDISPKEHLGLNENYRRAISKLSGDYVAILEGDDFWLDPITRIAKMIVPFMDYSNVKFVFSRARLSHNNNYISETNSHLKKILYDINDLYATINEYNNFNFIVNWSSAMFRVANLQQIPNEIYLNFIFSEIPVQLALLQNGGYAYFEQSTLTTYRIHDKGIWSGATPEQKDLMYYQIRRSAYSIALPDGKKILYPLLLSCAQKLISKNLLSETDLITLQSDYLNITSEKPKGIILAGGKGTRLYPLTLAVCKPLLPVYDKPMIYYPLSTLMLAGIKDILIISTPDDLVALKKLLGNGSKLGINLSYTIQEKPKGIAEAFLLGSDFIKNSSCVLALGDNIFYGNGLIDKLNVATKAILKDKATVFGYYVTDPERFGIIELDSNNKPISIEEKPKQPKSNYCVTGLYFYPSGVIEKAKMLKPSSRNELEITDLNKLYLDDNSLNVQLLGRGNLWFDTGTYDSLLEASNCIRMIQSHQNLQICCPEEIAYNNGWITTAELLKIADDLSTTNYGNYLKTIAKNNENKKF